MSEPLEAALPLAPSPPPTEARGARLARLRGVSVAEIAARIGVGEKRMRAIIRETLARRMPHPPQEFVAIQVGRLNEALLVAFSAMSTTNLKAVDQVVKIVRNSTPMAAPSPRNGAAPNRQAPKRLSKGRRRSARRGYAAWNWRCRTLKPPLTNSPAAIARKFRRKALKMLNPRPELLASEARASAGLAPDGGSYAQGAFNGIGLASGALLGGGDRPESPQEDIETIRSAPGNGWLGWAAGGSGALPSPLVPYPIRPGRVRTAFWRASANLHPEQRLATVAAFEVAVTGERPQRKEL